MRKIVFLFLFVVLTCGFSCSQTVPHTGTINFTVSPTTGASTNVYRGTCASLDATTHLCAVTPTFTKVGNVVTGVAQYIDSGLVPSTSYEYYLTSVCTNGSCPGVSDGESVPSMHVAGTTKGDAAAPSNLILIMK